MAAMTPTSRPVKGSVPVEDVPELLLGALAFVLAATRVPEFGPSELGPAELELGPVAFAGVPLLGPPPLLAPDTWPS